MDEHEPQSRRRRRHHMAESIEYHRKLCLDLADKAGMSRGEAALVVMLARIEDLTTMVDDLREEVFHVQYRFAG